MSSVCAPRVSFTYSPSSSHSSHSSHSGLLEAYDDSDNVSRSVSPTEAFSPSYHKWVEGVPVFLGSPLSQGSTLRVSPIIPFTPDTLPEDVSLEQIFTYCEYETPQKSDGIENQDTLLQVPSEDVHQEVHLLEEAQASLHDTFSAPTAEAPPVYIPQDLYDYFYNQIYAQMYPQMFEEVYSRVFPMIYHQGYTEGVLSASQPAGHPAEASNGSVAQPSQPSQTTQPPSPCSSRPARTVRLTTRGNKDDLKKLIDQLHM